MQLKPVTLTNLISALTMRRNEGNQNPPVISLGVRLILYEAGHTNIGPENVFFGLKVYATVGYSAGTSGLNMRRKHPKWSGLATCR